MLSASAYFGSRLLPATFCYSHYRFSPSVYGRRLTSLSTRSMSAGKGKGENGSVKVTVSPYDEAMDALSSLITKRSRADKSNKGDRFDVLFDYIKILELEEPIKQMKVIHVAGTKGKGSTCSFTESILRNCGFHTGLFTSPHLIDIRERFRLDGVDISEEKFLSYFWWCWARLKENASEDVPMPTYFRFLAILAFKIFAAEQVDVAILEVGLGGKFDATNVVEKPVVCGIASLGYDHMEILGNTLGQIAGEKAGIFKHGVPAFTVPQPEEAMHVLEEKASKLDVHLEIAAPLDPRLLGGVQLGLDGEHQYTNAGLAIALCSTWLQRTGHSEVNYVKDATYLPEQFIKGLSTTALQGRAQIVHDNSFENESSRNLVFYLDGAHSPESMDVCGKWFSLAVNVANKHDENNSKTVLSPEKNSMQILLFNCMSVRDPQILLQRLKNACAIQGVNFTKAIFVPNTSVYYKVGTTGLTSSADDSHVDLTWQLNLQSVWENLVHQQRGITLDECTKESIQLVENSHIFSTLPLAINWLRETSTRSPSVRFQVLVTGSLHLVGDVLNLVK